MSFNAKRDAAVADQAISERAFMCSASGCPNRWSVNFGRPLCSAHSSADPHQWPQVTQEQLDAETARALIAAAPKAQATVKHWSAAEKKALLQRLRAVFAEKRNPRAWAERLRDRERSGARLGEAQRQMWREALGAAAPLPFDDLLIDADRQEREAAKRRRIAEYAEAHGIAL